MKINDQTTTSKSHKNNPIADLLSTFTETFVIISADGSNC